MHLYNGDIGRPKLSEQKNPFEYIIPPSPLKFGKEQQCEMISILLYPNYITFNYIISIIMSPLKSIGGKLCLINAYMSHQSTSHFRTF